MNKKIYISLVAILTLYCLVNYAVDILKTLYYFVHGYVMRALFNLVAKQRDNNPKSTVVFGRFS